MYLQTVIELTMVLDSEKFQRIMTGAYGTVEQLDDENYIDHSLDYKGITVRYRDSQYKKKVKLIIKPEYVLEDDKIDLGKLIRKLEKRIDDYFDSKYRLNDFMLTTLILQTDIDVHDRDKVVAYLKTIQRVGRVKGFSPTRNNWIDDNISFCLDGNSNGIQFMIYDLEGLLRGQLAQAESSRKQLKAIIEKSKGLLRTEVRLVETKSIRSYTDETHASDQIADLFKKREDVFLDTFMRIVPFGDFLKMDKAKEIIRAKVSDVRMRRRCLRLLSLIPEKRSLLLSQKTLNYRKVDEVMEAFNLIEVSPVTISKRLETKKLDNLYNYM